MTTSMPAVPDIRTIELPQPGFPMLTRMVSNPLFLDDKGEPKTWIVGQPHPLVTSMKVMRMFVADGGVEVYSVSDDGKAGMRNLVPMATVRLTEEAMPLDVFADELAAAEGFDELEGEEPSQPAAQATPNGSGVS
jgi:hypothetical protein